MLAQWDQIQDFSQVGGDLVSNYPSYPSLQSYFSLTINILILCRLYSEYLALESNDAFWSFVNYISDVDKHNFEDGKYL